MVTVAIVMKRRKKRMCDQGGKMQRKKKKMVKQWLVIKFNSPKYLCQVGPQEKRMSMLTQWRKKTMECPRVLNFLAGTVQRI